MVGQDAKNAGSQKAFAIALVEGMEHVLAAKPDIQSGKTTLFAKGAGLSNHKLTIGSGNALTFGEVDPSSGVTNRRQRKLSATSGDISVLVVRVTTADASLTKSKIEISGDVFGTIGSGDSINLKSLVAQCSANEARINPGDGTGSTCVDNPDAIFDNPAFNCDYFNRYSYSTTGDLCPVFGDSTQLLPTVDGTDIKACRAFGLLSSKDDANVCLSLLSLIRYQIGQH